MAEAEKATDENRGLWIREASKLTEKVAELEIRLKYAPSESNARRLTGELHKAQRARSKYKDLLGEEWKVLEARKALLKEQADRNMHDKKLEKAARLRAKRKKKGGGIPKSRLWQGGAPQ